MLMRRLPLHRRTFGTRTDACHAIQCADERRLGSRMGGIDGAAVWGRLLRLLMPETPSSVFRLVASLWCYAPLHRLAAVVRDEAAERLALAVREEDRLVSGPLRPIVEHLLDTATAAPEVRSGPLSSPLFLAVIPTRGCNMACPYCDFAAPESGGSSMDLRLARAAVDGYLALLGTAGCRHGAIHFFGGEPFHAPDVVEFVVEYADQRAGDLDITLHFEATTNGLFSVARAQWVADRFSTIVLSLDGPAGVQDCQRPALNSRPTFGIVSRTAKLLSRRAGRIDRSLNRYGRFRGFAGRVGDLDFRTAQAKHGVL